MQHPARTIPPDTHRPGNFRAGKRGASAALRLKVREPQRKPIGSRGRLSPREDGATPLLDHPPQPGNAGTEFRRRFSVSRRFSRRADFPTPRRGGFFIRIGDARKPAPGKRETRTVRIGEQASRHSPEPGWRPASKQFRQKNPAARERWPGQFNATCLRDCNEY